MIQAKVGDTMGEEEAKTSKPLWEGVHLKNIQAGEGGSAFEKHPSQEGEAESK